MALTRVRAEQILDIDFKQAVRVLSSSNIADLATAAPSIVDSVALSLNDRILVSGQDAAEENGLYYVAYVGSGSNGEWVRTQDGNVTGEINAGMIVMVTEGYLYADTLWKLITDNPIDIGVTELEFVLNSQASFDVINANGTPVSANTISSTINYLTGNNMVITGLDLTDSITYAVADAPDFAGNVTTQGNLFVARDVSITGNLTIGANLNVVNVNEYVGATGNISFLGNLLPGSSNVINYNLGLPGQPWANIFVANLNVANYTGSDINVSGTATAGNLIVTTDATVNGNLTVLGTTTTINSNVIVTNDKNIELANNISTLVNLDGAGLQAGNAANTYVTNWTYNYAANAWSTNVGISAVGNISGNVFSGNGALLSNINAANITGSYGNANVAAYAEAGFAGNIIPSANVTYSLGNINNQWKSIYVGANTLYINNVAVSVNSANGLTVDGANVTTQNANGNITAGNVSTTGNITGNYILGNGVQLTGIVTLTDLSNTNSNVSNLTTSLGNTNSNVSNLSNSLSNTNSNVSNVVLDLANTNSNVSNTNSNVANLTTSLSNTNSNISNIVLDIANTNSNVSNLTTSLGNTNSNVSNLSNALANTNSNVTTLSNTVANNSANITTLQGNVYANANVAAYLPTYTGNITANIISATGNLTGNYILGNIAFANGLPTTYGNSNVADYLPTYTGDITAANISITGLLTATTELIGPDTSANLTRFPYAQVVVSSVAANIQKNEGGPIGLIAEGVGNSADTSHRGVGVYGVGYTSGAASADGVTGEGHVSASGDTGTAVGVRGYADDVHTGGINIGLYGTAINAATNYALYMKHGNILSFDPQDWTLVANTASALSIESVAKAGILNVDTTAGTERVTMSGNLSVVGNIAGNVFIGNGSQLTGITVTSVSGTAATVTTNAQPNITSVGTLTTLTVTGNITGNVFIGNGSQLTGIVSTTDLANTNSNVSNLSNSLSNTNSNVSNTNSNVANLTTSLSNTNSNVSNVASNVTSLQGQVYANANVASYLPTYTGDITANIITTTGNVTTAGWLISGNSISAAGTLSIAGGNLFVNGLGNVQAGNLLTNGRVSATGNVTGAYILGNGSQLTGITVTSVSGTAATVTTNAQPNITSVGTLTTVTVTGNTQSGNLLSAGLLSITGNVTSGNVNTDNSISAGGNVTSNNITVTNTANVGILYASSGASVTGTLTATYANAQFVNQTAGAGWFSAAGNIYGANSISVAGNIAGSYYIGNGSQLTGISVPSVAGTAATVTTNAQPNITSVGTLTTLTVSGNTQSGNLLTAGFVSATGNITGNVYLGNGSQLTGLVSVSGTAATVTDNAQPNITSIGTLTTLTVTGNTQSGNLLTAGLISATGNLTAGNANIIGTTASTSKTTGALTVAGGVGVAGDVYAGNSIVVDGGTYGNVVTTQFAGVFATASGPNPYSIMQVRSNDGTTGMGIQAYTGLNGKIYSDSGITFTTGATIKDKDYPTGGTTRATLDSTGLAVTGIVSASGNVTGGNINTDGLISATGNIQGNVIIGNGSQLTGLVSVSGTAATITTNAQPNITSVGTLTTLTVTGNTQSGNLLTAGLISATGNISSGNVSVTGNLAVTYTAANVGSGLQISAANTEGGVGYADFLRVTNTSGGATNPNKSLRLNSTGSIEIINSAYTATLFTLTDTGNLAVPGTMSASNLNGPSFRAYISVAQTITSGSQQKVTFGGETFDTNNNFASSTFTPTVSGYYQLNATVRLDGSSSTGECMIVLYKNGTEYARGTNESGTEQGANFWSMQVSDVAFANGSTDTFEIYIQQVSGGSRSTTAGQSISYFSGVMVRGA